MCCIHVVSTNDREPGVLPRGGIDVFRSRVSFILPQPLIKGRSGSIDFQGSSSSLSPAAQSIPRAPSPQELIISSCYPSSLPLQSDVRSKPASHHPASKPVFLTCIPSHHYTPRAHTPVTTACDLPYLPPCVSKYRAWSSLFLTPETAVSSTTPTLPIKPNISNFSNSRPGLCRGPSCVSSSQLSSALTLPDGAYPVLPREEAQPSFSS